LRNGPRGSDASGSADVAPPENWHVRPEDHLIADLSGQTRVLQASFSDGP
jgi:hypothetical protein